jgi:hypothetical protein
MGNRGAGDLGNSVADFHLCRFNVRSRDLRKLRKEAAKTNWAELWKRPEEALADEAWLDAIAENQTRSNELEKLSYAETRKRSRT